LTAFFISGALGLELAEGNNTKYVLPVLFILVKKSKSLDKILLILG
jgi:hypothetical protein